MGNNNLESGASPEHEGCREPIVQEFKKGEWPSRTIERDESRPPATPEMKEQMDRELLAFARLMKGSGIWWQIDGALNISLRKIAAGGDYIGMHKDVDFSMFSGDLPALKKHIEARGYGLFHYDRDEQTDTRRFEEVSDDRVGKRFDSKLRVLAVDREGGKINKNADLLIAGPIVHRRGEGGQFLGWRGIVYPEKWLEGETIDFKGAPITLSHPARFVFNKLFSEGKYHGEDLGTFVLEMKAVSGEDMQDIARVFDERDAKIATHREAVAALAEKIAREVTSGITPEEIYDVAKRKILPDHFEKIYGAAASDDPEGIARDIEEMARAVSLIPEPTKESILAELTALSFLDKAHAVTEGARARFESLRERRLAQGD